MEASLPVWFEITSYVVLLSILAFDLILAYRRPHVPSTKESAIWVSIYVGLALVFALLMLWQGSVDHAAEFIAGWVTEYSLSIDNLFVFVIIMARFSVPRKYQQEVLMVGILIALVLRGLFILAGAALIENFSFVFYIFGLFLVYTAIQQARQHHDDMEQQENAIIQLLRKRIAISDTYNGAKLRTTIDGKRVFTPILVVFVALGITDLVFALDSIPAIFGITTDPFIVFTANIFALMGLRQLYFLLGDLIDKLEYLHYGIAFILAFIGVKLFFHALAENELPFINGGEHVEWAPEISTWASLAVILSAMTISVVASLVKIRIDKNRASKSTESVDR
ncbi:tellurium resistance protein TerC [Salinibacterium xinjiangense]|uniref:Tellurite resistance protein TerC n=1 Tax=Salinibacterium xinjiangense TaxID=386302 RepID=A0A2C8YT34_9MICO|nr:TerC family protein [Salinibacterium xinjiangense]GGK99690.1 tellurium resistance protein TerC [Salinibacterium xinjiangense]SOE53812.1 tellurite resistance protein TerC [Salinibacterium xinjiangense]